MEEEASYKIQHKLGSKQGKFSMYKSLVYGEGSFLGFFYFELINLFLSGIPGALGIILRQILYRPFFKKIGKGVLFGRNIVIRHPKSIEIGDNTVLDDNVLIDAKGKGNSISLKDNVYIGRNTILSSKNGDITIQRDANIGHNCILFSSNSLVIGEGTMVAAFTHILSGGEYDYASSVPFCKQAGKTPEKPTLIGKNCWLGSNVTVISEKIIGDHCVIGAKSLVSKDIPPDSLAFGTRIQVYKNISLKKHSSTDRDRTD